MAATGRTVPELFAERGEAAFRAEESRVLAEALTGHEPVVVSAAGGVVLAPANRELLAASGIVVWLRADPHAGRAGGAAGRAGPLLGEDPPSALVDLDAVRRPFYEEVADGGHRRRRADAARWSKRLLSCAARPGPGASEPVADRESGHRGPRARALRGAGRRGCPPRAGRRGRRRRAPAPDGRPSSPRPASTWTVDTGLPASASSRCPTGRGPSRWPWSRDLCRGFARAGISRSDVVMAVGGGVVTDLAGFAAADLPSGHGLRERGHHPARPRWTRPSAARPGVNLPEGKNLVGAFWQPKAVLCDTEVLATLPAAGVGVGPGRDGQVRTSLGEPVGGRRAVRSASAAGAPPRRAGGPLCGHQGRRWWRPTSARAAGEHGPQLRPHPGPRPRGHRLRRRRRCRPPPRRGGGGRPGVRRPAGPSAGSRSTTGRSITHRRVVVGFRPSRRPSRRL